MQSRQHCEPTPEPWLPGLLPCLPQVESLQGQARSLTDMQTQAQNYNAQLQQYNSKMQGELQVGGRVSAGGDRREEALRGEPRIQRPACCALWSSWHLTLLLLAATFTHPPAPGRQ